MSLASSLRYQQAHKRAGLCVLCRELATVGVLCHDHAARGRVRGRDAYRAKIGEVKVHLCGVCKQPGHNAITCPRSVDEQTRATIDRMVGEMTGGGR